MKTCERLRPLLSRFAEGEADPEEALGVAAHLGDCTACKIVLARERRLHEALEVMCDAVPVDEEFSRLVMAALPAAPPPNFSLARRRGLRLAGLLAIGSVGGALALRLLGFAAGAGPARLVSRLDFEGGSRLLNGLETLTGVAAALLGRIASGAHAPLRPVGGDLRLAFAPLAAALALLACGTILAFTTWAVARRPRGTRDTGFVRPGEAPDRDH
jgi:anti-sigma factor RsiW